MLFKKSLQNDNTKTFTVMLQMNAMEVYFNFSFPKELPHMIIKIIIYEKKTTYYTKQSCDFLKKDITSNNNTSLH